MKGSSGYVQEQGLREIVFIFIFVIPRRNYFFFVIVLIIVSVGYAPSAPLQVKR